MKVFFPYLLHCARETMIQVMEYERFRFMGLFFQLQSGLLRRAVPFFRIAFPAAANHILPRGTAATGTRQDMIHRQISAFRPAILAGILVAAHHVLFAERNLASARNIHIRSQPYDGGEVKLHRFAADEQTVRLDGIGFSVDHHANRTTSVADIYRLICLVEHQDA